MTAKINSAEGGVHGDAVTVANSGGASGDAFSAITAGVLVYDTAAALSGSLGHRAVPIGGSVRECRWDFAATDTLQFCVAFQRTTVPTFAHRIIQFRSASGMAAGITLQVTSSGRLVVENRTAAVYNNALSNLTEDTPYRIEIKVKRGTTSGNGEIHYALYTLTGTTPIAFYDTTTTDTGTADLTEIRWARPSGSTADETSEYWDNYQAWSGVDIPATLVNVFPAAGPTKIPFTLTQLSASSARLAWTAPGDAPDGITVIRADGIQTNDGMGRAPNHVDYDPLTLVGAGVLVEGQASPYDDIGLAPQSYTWWIVRTAP